MRIYLDVVEGSIKDFGIVDGSGKVYRDEHRDYAGLVANIEDLIKEKVEEYEDYGQPSTIILRIEGSELEDVESLSSEEFYKGRGK